jgi:hypothetical protein
MAEVFIFSLGLAPEVCQYDDEQALYGAFPSLLVYPISAILYNPLAWFPLPEMYFAVVLPCL